MQRLTYTAAASLFLLFLSVGPASAQPTAEEPVNIGADTLDSTNQIDVAVYTVPAGRQLIIDNVSLRVDLPAGEQVLGSHMNLPSVHFFVVSSQGTVENRSYFAAGQSTRIVVGSGQKIIFRVTRSHYGTPAYVYVALAGRLVKG